MPQDSPPLHNKTATSPPTRKNHSFNYHQNSPWTKKNANNMFDVTMGSYDGAETCELIGAYMLSLLAPKFKNEVGLYHDDGLAICKATPKEIEKPKQEVCQVFKSNGLKSQSKLTKRSSTFLMWPSTSQMGATSHLWNLIINCPMSTNRVTTP